MKKWIAVVTLLGLLAACKSAPPVKNDASGDLANKSEASAIAQPDDSAGPVSAGEVGTNTETVVGLPPELANRTIIYFAFDSDAISAEDQALLAAHAQFLGSRPGLRVRLEGSYGRAGHARIQHRPQRASRSSGSPGARSAGCRRFASQHRELW